MLRGEKRARDEPSSSHRPSIKQRIDKSEKKNHEFDDSSDEDDSIGWPNNDSKAKYKPGKSSLVRGKGTSSNNRSSKNGNTDGKSDNIKDIDSDDEKYHIPAFHGSRIVDDCYDPLGSIDEGSFGVVHRAKDRQTGGIVALKKIKLQKGTTANGFPNLALREINIMLSIRHPNIVQLIEIVVSRRMSPPGIFMVMEFMDHDVKVYMNQLPDPFRQAEVKCLLKQLLQGVNVLHQHWILHRDLKTSNLLLSKDGILKICDFGLARKFGRPLGDYTDLVCTLWYRAPEILLSAPRYGPALDMWSVGCIFAELLTKKPLIDGEGEMDQLQKMFTLLGTPTEEEWPGLADCGTAKNFRWTVKQSTLRQRFLDSSLASGGSTLLSPSGFDLLSKFLIYNPDKRITAEEALEHAYFTEQPLPIEPSALPTMASANEDKELRSALKAAIYEPKDALLHQRGGDGEGDDDSVGFRL